MTTMIQVDGATKAFTLSYQRSLKQTVLAKARGRKTHDSFNAVDDLKLNGRLTLGENTADNGGARIALMALLANMQQAASKGGGAEQAAQNQDGFTPEQRFFLGFANVWCEKRTPEFSRMLVSVDPHSPGRWRTNGVVQNMPEFQKAWNCKPGQPMVRANACHVW